MILRLCGEADFFFVVIETLTFWAVKLSAESNGPSSRSPDGPPVCDRSCSCNRRICCLLSHLIYPICRRKTSIMLSYSSQPPSSVE